MDFLTSIKTPKVLRELQVVYPGLRRAKGEGKNRESILKSKKDKVK